MNVDAMIARFMAKVAQPAHGGACWFWSGARHHSGYGSFRFDGRPQSAHRVAWQMFRGPIPDGMHVLHRCDNRRCVNFDHLFLGTNADNVADREAKGRNVVKRGDEHGSAKLSAADVREILGRTGRQNQYDTAEDFGVSQALISKIQRREIWRSL